MIEKWILDFSEPNENTLKQNQAKSLEFKVTKHQEETQYKTCQLPACPEIWTEFFFHNLDISSLSQWYRNNTSREWYFWIYDKLLCISW